MYMRPLVSFANRKLIRAAPGWAVVTRSRQSALLRVTFSTEALIRCSQARWVKMFYKILSVCRLLSDDTARLG